MPIENMFGRYSVAVAEALGSRPSKQTAIRLSKQPMALEPETFRRLYETLCDEGWSKHPGSNWQWRSQTPACQPASPEEVRLERAVADGREGMWTCQISTASGIQAGHPNKRRAIDLVRQIESGHFAFIELKVDSDNPLYAAFEILGYAMAYRHAREANTCGSGTHNVMRADTIDLVVLGPDDWYTYKQGRKNPTQVAYKLDWLTQAINHGLAALPGQPVMKFCFKTYNRHMTGTSLDIDMTAKAIVDHVDWTRC